MTVDGTTPTGGSLSGLSGPDYATAVNEEVASLATTRTYTVSSAAGTNTLTGTVSEITALAAGMQFAIVWPTTNTSTTVTLNINSYGAADVVDPSGDAPAIGDLVANDIAILRYDGTDFQILSPTFDRLQPDVQTFSADGTWTKPTGCPDDAIVRVEIWGGGGGGGANAQASGGGGGCCIFKTFAASELGSTEGVTIGAGGTTTVAGGNSTFGTSPVLITAYGGGPGINGSAGTISGGGGGGGCLSVGGTPSGSTAGAGGTLGGGEGGGGGVQDDGDEAISFGGGGGGTCGPSNGAGNGGNGGNAIYGGAGGGGSNGTSGTDGTGGTSIFGGNGGDTGVAGTVPGGGGGGGAAGADGYCRVITVM